MESTNMNKDKIKKSFKKHKIALSSLLIGTPLGLILFAIWTLISGKAQEMDMTSAAWIMIFPSAASILLHVYNQVTLPDKNGYNFFPDKKVVSRFIIREIQVFSYGILSFPAACIMGDRLLGLKRMVPVPYNWLGLLVMLPALYILIWTFWLFATKGKGTPIPFEATQKLIIVGPYRYMRNPMVISVTFVMGGLAIILGTYILFVVFILLFVQMYLYTVRIEEPEMEARFGQEYEKYKSIVPRWFPRWKRRLDTTGGI